MTSEARAEKTNAPRVQARGAQGGGQVLDHLTTGVYHRLPGDKLLAEWFWTDRWMGSSAFLLPMEARGLYREMLTQAWRRGARLPNDPEAIRRATGTTDAEWERSWPKIKRYWRTDGDNLVNDTQLEVFASAKEAQERAQARAQAGAQASAQARRERKLKQSPPSPSPSPFSVSVKERTDERNERQAAVNPLISGERVKWERECLGLVRRMCELTGEDGATVMARASKYDGARRTKLNPATMTDDRLMNTVLDLRADVQAEEKKRGTAQPRS